ncbi:MAG: hypothetical protein KGK05_11820 [Xanthomonadaceae bacterium]|nr:hypothetical protein [Xanthomonadaceae bacterium]
MKSKKVYFAQIVLAAAALALAGCGMLKKDEDASVIKAKAVQRWDDLIARKADKAYDFLAPGYRKTISREQYAKDMNGRGMRWKKVSFGSQTCDADTCTVHLTVAYNINLGGLAGKVDSMGLAVETWIKVDGTWYYLPQIASPKLDQGAEK